MTAVLPCRRYRYLAYLDGGPAEGPPLFLLHGGTMTADWNWRAALPAFTERYRVIAPDTPGHGHSANPRPELRYADIAGDVLGLADELGLDSAAFYGFSDGAQIALELAMLEPNFPTALVLSAVMHKLTPSYCQSMNAFLGSDGPAGPKWSADHPEMAADLIGRHADWPSLAPQIADLWTRPFELAAEELARVTAPTLLLTGDRDRFIALEQTLELMRLLPAAELAVIPGAGHDYDERFTSAVIAFLESHLAAADARTRASSAASDS